MNKNQICEILIEGYTSEGEGVGRYEGMAVFVPYALKGERVSVRIENLKKTYAHGKMLKVLESSGRRQKHECPVYYQCGGCSCQHMTYEAELEFKTEKVAQILKRIGGLSVNVHPCEPSPDTKEYRNKAQFPVGLQEGKICAGFYAKASHNIINSQSCIIQNDISKRCLTAVLNFMEQYGIAPYCEKTGKGIIRHVYVRCGKNALLTIVTNGRQFPHADKLIEIVKESCPEVLGIVQNINSRKTNVIMGSQCITLWGDGRVSDSMCGLDFEISPLSFYQVNRPQAEKLYSKAAELLKLSGKEELLDLYCGIGTITLFMSRFAKYVYGVEIIPDAVENARKNAEINNIHNAEFFVGDAKEASAKFENIDAVVIDPPRSGCSEEVIEHLVRINPEKIAYISCNPSTLARDLKIFAEKGYSTKDVYPYDLFPRTYHTEAVCLLSKSI